MRQKHSPTAIPSKTDFIQQFSHLLFLIQVCDFVLELLPFVGDYFTAAEASNWDYHLFSPIFQIIINSIPLIISYTHFYYLLYLLL